MEVQMLNGSFEFEVEDSMVASSRNFRNSMEDRGKEFTSPLVVSNWKFKYSIVVSSWKKPDAVFEFEVK